MGEQPIFTTKAHVFQIDPATKKKWLPASSQAVNVSFYYDSTRNTYRIISVENAKAVVNSTITANMLFTKTSQKFGQWADPRANTVYGLGFPSEADLTMFIDKFKEVKDLIRQGHNQLNGADLSDNVDSNPGSPKPSALQNELSSALLERRNSSNTPSSPASEAQLKYENDRLKIALAQSSANAKKWEVELQTLKNNNTRLTTALQESTTNVDEWKKQLSAYKEESARMKKRVLELEKGGAANESNQQQVRELTDRIQQLEITTKMREQEAVDAMKKVEELPKMAFENKDKTEKIASLQKDNDDLRAQLHVLNDQISSGRSEKTREKQQLRDVHDQMSRKITELGRLNDQVTILVQQPP